MRGNNDGWVVPPDFEDFSESVATLITSKSPGCYGIDAEILNMVEKNY